MCEKSHVEEMENIRDIWLEGGGIGDIRTTKVFVRLTRTTFLHSHSTFPFSSPRVKRFEEKNVAALGSLSHHFST